MGWLTKWIDKGAEGEREKQAHYERVGGYAKEAFKSAHEVTGVGEKGSESSFKRGSDKRTMMLWFAKIGDNPEELAKARTYFIHSLRSSSVPAESAGKTFDRYYEIYRREGIGDED